MSTRIKHNDLTHWFIRDHNQLPDAYLRKCEKFFQSIQDRLITKKDAAFLFKHQAASDKLQASSFKQQAATLLHMYMKNFICIMQRNRKE